MSGFSFRRILRLRPRTARERAREIDDEIETHVALRAEQLRARGLSPAAARAEALRRFGDLEGARSTLIASARRRDERVELRERLASIGQDAAFALRQIRRAPGFAALAALTLALGVGLTTAVFAAVNGVLLRPLPFEHAGRLVTLQALDSLQRPVFAVSADDWFDWSNDNRTFDGIAISLAQRTPIVVGHDAMRVSGATVSPNFFRVLGTTFVAGRGFDARSVAAGARAAVVGEALWRRTLGARRDSALTILIQGERYDVVGVVADGHEYPDGTEVWLPYRHQQRGGATRNNINWQALGRLRPGVSAAQAAADVAAIARRVRATDPMALYSYGALVTPLRDEVVGAAARYLRLLLGAVALVLLIGCANLASANLARGAMRRQEMAVRAALGAGRGRIVRQLLVEHLMLAAIGGAAGVVLAWGLVRGIVLLSASQLPRVREVHVDGRVLAFGVVISAVAGIAAGLLPAIDAGRASLRGAIGSAGRGTIRGGSAGRVLVATEIALAVMLVSGAGLLIQSFRMVLARSLGFETRGVVTAELTLDGARYGRDPATSLRFWNELLPSLRATPGVVAAGATNWIPLGTAGTTFLEFAGRDVRGAGAGYRVVSDGYFDAMRIPLVRGRAFDARDDSSAARVAVVNQRMAALYWPGEDPIGQAVRAPSMEIRRAGTPAAWLTIVGVVGDVRHFGLETEPRPELYVALAQQPFRAFSLTAVVRGASVASVARIARARIHAIDPDVAADIEPLSSRLDRSMAERRFTMSVLSLFGALALALAGLGVYGVLSFSVSQRTRELAVRAALGAERGALLRLVLGAGLRVVCAGAAAGLLAALALTRLMRSMLFEVSARDPAVLATAMLTIVAVGVAAALVPAYRATRVEPMRVLD